MAIKIGLAGNPNCGKTTMFNALTGSNQYVGNWPGVTVEKKSGKVKWSKEIEIVDLPGVYSLSPYTMEEVVTRNFILDDNPDVIINIIDASNIERNLYLTTQVLELGVPTVIALNMMDVVRKNGTTINKDKLSELLGCTVVETSALKGEGIKELIEEAKKCALARAKQKFKLPMENAEETLKHIESIVNREIDHKDVSSRYIAVKLFERDENISKKFNVSDHAKNEIESLIKLCEEKLDDDSESIITGDRYEFISASVPKFLNKSKSKSVSTSDKIDKIITNRFLALPIFAVIMFLVYYVSMKVVGGPVTDWVNDTFFGEIISDNVRTWLVSMNVADWMQGLLVDGIIGGVGSVLGFVPQIMCLFLLMAILEDCGYMARIAFIMDRIFRKFGLSGKSFIPMLISSGCGVPGIMATRTMENDRDRKMTIMLTTFIPCQAKLPMIGIIAGAVLGGSSFVATGAYFFAIFMIVFCGIILKKTRLFAGEPAPFVMELPQYHMPGAKNVLLHMWDRALAFIKKAGTIIFASCIVIWFLQSFDFRLNMVEENNSILAAIGNVIAPIFAPLGFGNWQSAVASITGIVAKENLVSTFAVLLGIEAEAGDPALTAKIVSMFTTSGALAFVVFNMLCAPCFAAIGAIKREMGSAKWTWIAIGFQTFTAYIAALVVNQVGGAILGTGSVVGAAVSILILVAVVLIAVMSGRKTVTGEAFRAEA